MRTIEAKNLKSPQGPIRPQKDSGVIFMIVLFLYMSVVVTLWRNRWRSKTLVGILKTFPIIKAL